MRLPRRIVHEKLSYRLVTGASTREVAHRVGKKLESMGKHVIVTIEGPHSFGVYERVAAGMKKNPVDAVGARELCLYIDNHASLYRQMHVPIMENLRRKMKKGTYDSSRAVTGFLYEVDEGARLYNQEFGDGTKSMKLFDKDTRLEVARELRDHFETEEGVAKNPKTKKNPPLTVFGLGNPPKKNPFLKKGTRVRVRSYYSRVGQGLSYSPFHGILLEDTSQGGWDVVDVQSDNKKKSVSVYAFSLDPEKKNPRESPRVEEMSREVTEIRYIHLEDGHAYKHSFKKGVRMAIQEEGSVLLYHPTKRIWDDF